MWAYCSVGVAYVMSHRLVPDEYPAKSIDDQYLSIQPELLRKVTSPFAPFARHPDIYRRVYIDRRVAPTGRLDVRSRPFDSPRATEPTEHMDGRDATCPADEPNKTVSVTPARENRGDERRARTGRVRSCR